jgi:hypothetical protein
MTRTAGTQDHGLGLRMSPATVPHFSGGPMYGGGYRAHSSLSPGRWRVCRVTCEDPGLPQLQLCGFWNGSRPRRERTPESHVLLILWVGRKGSRHNQKCLGAMEVLRKHIIIRAGLLPPRRGRVSTCICWACICHPPSV